MSKRAVEITETYTPGKKFGNTRTVTVDGIPAEEVIYDGMIDTHTTFRVFGRVQCLVRRALRANEVQHQRITYTPSKPRGGQGYLSRRRPAATSDSGGSVPGR